MPEPATPASLRLRADAALVGVTFVWGSSFVVIRNALRDAPPLPVLFWRFVLATLLLLPLARRRRKTPGLFRDGLAVGLILAASLSLQFVGQVETTASNAGFLAGLAVVLTPFVAYLRTGRPPSRGSAIGVALAGTGFFLLTVPASGIAIRRGDVFVLASAVVFAFYVVEVAQRTGRHDPLRLTAIQLSVVAATGGFLALAFHRPLGASILRLPGEGRPLVWTAGLALSVLYLASIGGVGVFVAQTWAQRHMSATHAAILFALEPVFAALLAALFLSETLRPRGFLGGALVILGIVVSEVRLRRERL